MVEGVLVGLACGGLLIVILLVFVFVFLYGIIKERMHPGSFTKKMGIAKESVQDKTRDNRSEQ